MQDKHKIQRVCENGARPNRHDNAPQDAAFSTMATYLRATLMDN